MADSFNGSYRGEHVDGPQICVRNFTDNSSNTRTMPMVSLAVFDVATTGYDEVTVSEPFPVSIKSHYAVYADGDTAVTPNVHVVAWADGSTINAIQPNAPLPINIYGDTGSLIPLDGNKNICVAPTDSTNAPIYAATQSMADNIANPTVGIIGSVNLAWNATNGTWERIQTTASGNRLVVSQESVIETGTSLGGTEKLTLIGINSGGNATTISTTNPLPINVENWNTSALNVDINTVSGFAINLGNGVVSTGTQRVTLASDSTGQVALAAGTNGIGKLTSNSGVVIGSVEIASAQTLATVTNLAQLGGTAIAMGTGTRSSGTQRVTIATDDVVPIVGTVAHDGADSGNPLKIGGKASTTLPTAVSATGDRVDAAFDRHGYQIIRSGGQAVNAWSKQHTPSSNTQATIAQSAAGSGLKNVCTSITATLACGSTAPTANQVYLYLRDGTTGSGTILWSAAVSIPATAGSMSGVSISDIWIPGTANTAMTIEFSAAGGTNTVETVSMTGTIVAE